MAGLAMGARISASTVNAWLKAKEEPIYRNNPLLAMMKKRGLIKYKAGEIGTTISWDLPYAHRKLREIGGEVTDRAFVSGPPKLHMSLPWAAYDMTERITWLEKKINSNSQTQIYNLVKDTLGSLVDDFETDLGLKMWNDGSITNRGLQGYLSLHGASSTLSADGCYNQLGTFTPITPSDGTSAWWACVPSKTYAGQSTALGSKVDQWTGATDIAFPAGQFPTGYYVLSPLQIDYNSTRFTPSGSSSTHSFDTQWQQAFNAAETYQSKLMKEPVDTWICDADLVMRAKNSLIDNQRFVVSESSEIRSLGFRAIEYNGSELLSGYGVPDGACCGFTWSKMEMRLFQNQLIEREEDHDIRSSDDLYLLQSGHQLVFKSPRYFPIMVPATAAGS